MDCPYAPFVDWVVCGLNSIAEDAWCVLWQGSEEWILLRVALELRGGGEDRRHFKWYAFFSFIFTLSLWSAPLFMHLTVVRHILYLFLSWAVSSLFLGVLFLCRCMSSETIRDPRRAFIVDIIQETSRKVSPGVLTAVVCVGWAPYLFLRYG